MKVNEAPDKIYLSQERDKDGCYIDLMWHKHPYEDIENIQYVQTDAFIEKACEWLRNNSHNYVDNALGKEYLVNDFKDYMKGE